MSGRQSSDAKPLFMFGLPRSGTNLIARILNMHPEVTIAIHAFQPLFKSLRNAAISASNDAGLRDSWDSGAPVHDGHFDSRQRHALSVMQDVELDLQFSAAERPEIIRRLTARASDDAADICDGIPNLDFSGSYRGILDSSLTLLDECRPAGNRRWTGMIDTWTFDLLPVLARGYLDARFITIERDPRAIVSSMLGYLPVDPSQVGHILSVVRHWRREGVLQRQFERMADIDGRLLRIRYEDLVTDTRRVVAEVSAFLGIEFAESMLDLDEFVDLPTGRKWSGNSTFDESLDKISTVPVERWRSKLPDDARTMVEYAAGADMRLRGYTPIGPGRNDAATSLAFIIRDGNRSCGWRCDSGDPLVEFGLETTRRELLELDIADIDPELVRRCYLDPEYFTELQRRTLGFSGIAT